MRSQIRPAIGKSGTHRPASSVLRRLWSLQSDARRPVFEALENRRLFFGDPVFNINTLNGANGFSMAGIDTGSQLGFAVAQLGDVNGDKQPDFVVSAPYTGQTDLHGAAYVIFGSANLGRGGSFDLRTLDGSNGFKIEGARLPLALAGWSVSDLGDVNNDTYNDIAVSALGISEVFVLYGSASIGSSGVIDLSNLSQADGLVVTSRTNADIGFSITALHDFNRDGIDDFALGDPTGGGNDTGAVWVIYGGDFSSYGGLLEVETLNGSNGFSILGKTQGDDFGWSISGIGDFNVDGAADLLVGSPQSDAQNEPGTAYVVYGGAGVGGNGILNISTLDGTNGFEIVGAANGAGMGLTVAGIGDVNADGSGDIAVTDVISATAYIIFGAGGLGSGGTFNVQNLNGSNGFKVTLPDNAGMEVGPSGDLTGDAVSDLVCYVVSTESAYVVTGGMGLGSSGTIDLNMLDGFNGFAIPNVPTAVAFVGHTLSYINDVNADGMGDLLIGASGVNSDDGAAYVLYGVDLSQLMPPDAPSDLTGSATDATHVHLSWTDQSDNEDGFRIERSPDGTNGWTVVGTTGTANGTGSIVTFDDSNLTPDTTYYYRVRATLGDEVSDPSNIISVTTSDTVPADPSSLTVVPLSSDELSLHWMDNSDNEDGFHIERSADGSRNWSVIDTTAANQISYVDSGLNPDETWFYRIRAFNSVGASGYSNVASGTTTEVMGGGSGGGGGRGGLEYTDIDGDLVTFKLVNVAGVINWTLNGDGSIDTVFVATSTAGAGSFIVSVQRGLEGDGRVEIGQLAGSLADGDTYIRAGMISMPDVDLTGAGAWICNNNKTILGNVTGNASITGMIACLVMGDVDTTGTISLCNSYLITADSLFVQGGVSADSFNRVDVAGDAGFAISAGDAGQLNNLFVGGDASLVISDIDTVGSITIIGDLTLTSASAISGQLGSMLVRGSFDSGELFISDLLHNIDIRGDSGAGSHLTVTHGFVTIGGDASGIYELDRVLRLNIKGDVTGSSISFTGGQDSNICIMGDFDSGAISLDSDGLNCLKVMGSTGIGSSVDSAGLINKISIDQSADGDVASYGLGMIVIRQDTTGDWNIGPGGINRVRICGDLAEGTWNIGGGDTVCFMIRGDMGVEAGIDDSGRIEMFKVMNNMFGALSVDDAGVAMVCGDFYGKVIVYGAIEVGNALDRFQVSGTAQSGSTLSVVGDVGCALYNDVADTNVFVGLPENWEGGLPGGLSDFVRASVLHKLSIRGMTTGATIASTIIENLCANTISSGAVFALAAQHVNHARLTVESIMYNLGMDEIFTDLPPLSYLDIVQLAGI